MKSMSKKIGLKNGIIYFILIFFSLGMIFPLIYMLVLSLSESNFELISIFKNLSFGNYYKILVADRFDIYFLNSIIVALVVSLGNVLFCLMVAYAIVRKKNIYTNLVFYTILGVLIIPPHVIMIPLYRLMVNFGWINSYYALVVPWLVTPFGVFLAKQYLEKLPIEIENAAKIDGASDLYVLFKIVYPLSKPILVVLFIYTFLHNWNTFLFPFLFTNDEMFRTLPVGLTFYIGKQSISWPNMMAGAGLSSIPILILFIIFQRKIIDSLTVGALKE